MSYENETFIIEVDGQEISDLYCDLISLEVELDTNAAGAFRLSFHMELLPDGAWKHLDDDLFRPWKPVKISAGFADSTEEIMQGYITQIRPNFAGEVTDCTLDIWGMDGSVLMNRQEQLESWTNKKDSDIATEIFGTYGFMPEVEDTGVVHDEEVSTIIQRETDMQFLKRLAARNGYECFVEGMTAYFRPPVFTDPPQPLLAVHFGEETTVQDFTIEVDALAPGNVRMFQTDLITKEVLEASAEASDQEALGGDDAASLLAPGVDPAETVVSQTAAISLLEMNTLCQALYHEGEWFVSGAGQINGFRYGHVLKPHRTVTIKGIGETYSGLYFVTHVTHTFTPEGYTQRFRVKRNGLGLTGAEDFSGAAAGLLSGVL